jgi:hypothetical protein
MGLTVWAFVEVEEGSLDERVKEEFEEGIET